MIPAGHKEKADPGMALPRARHRSYLSSLFVCHASAGCYVVAVGGVRLREHVPERYRDLHTFDHSGDSYIIDPRGEVMAGPAKGETILTARCSLEAVYAAKAACDVGGHYSRPDIFQLHVNGQPLERVVVHADSVPSRSRADAGAAQAVYRSPFPGSADAKEPVDGNSSRRVRLPNKATAAGARKRAPRAP